MDEIKNLFSQRILHRLDGYFPVCLRQREFDVALLRLHLRFLGSRKNISSIRHNLIMETGSKKSITAFLGKYEKPLDGLPEL